MAEFIETMMQAINFYAKNVPFSAGENAVFELHFNQNFSISITLLLVILSSLDFLSSLLYFTDNR